MKEAGWFPRFDGDVLQLKRLMAQLSIDEGKSLRVYRDSLGFATVGIGHLLKPTDPPEFRNLKIGEFISKEQMQFLFETDLAIAISDFRVIFTDWATYPADVQEILINMLFNIGRFRFLGFKRLIVYIYARNWAKAADEMQNSAWFEQVGSRAKRLVARMRTVHALSD